MQNAIFEYPISEEKITIGDDPFSDLVVRQSELSPNKLFYRDDQRRLWLYKANCLEFMGSLNGRLDMMFADISSNCI